MTTAFRVNVFSGIGESEEHFSYELDDAIETYKSTVERVEMAQDNGVQPDIQLITLYVFDLAESADPIDLLNRVCYSRDTVILKEHVVIVE